MCKYVLVDKAVAKHLKATLYSSVYVLVFSYHLGQDCAIPQRKYPL